jgi:hypothetical protein
MVTSINEEIIWSNNEEIGQIERPLNHHIDIIFSLISRRSGAVGVLGDITWRYLPKNHGNLPYDICPQESGK